MDTGYWCNNCFVNGDDNFGECEECGLEVYCIECGFCEACDENEKDVYRDSLNAQNLDECMGIIYEEDDGKYIYEEDLEGNNIMHHFAKEEGYQVDLDNCLDSFGCDPLKENSEGKTIYEIADENGNSEIIEYLKNRNDYDQYLTYLSEKEIANIKPAKRR